MSRCYLIICIHCDMKDIVKILVDAREILAKVDTVKVGVCYEEGC